jgi:hypothetical protein
MTFDSLLHEREFYLKIRRYLHIGFTPKINLDASGSFSPNLTKV